MDVNDSQAKTDIFAIAMAVTYMCRKNLTYLKAISKWIYHNVFQYGKIKNIHNAAIRYYSRAIIECAFSEGAVTCKKVIKCRPPYRTDSSFISFAPEATTGTKMGGYKTMDYDLARYVLCDPLNRMFLSNRDYKCEIEYWQCPGYWHGKRNMAGLQNHAQKLWLTLDTASIRVDSSFSCISMYILIY